MGILKRNICLCYFSITEIFRDVSWSLLYRNYLIRSLLTTPLEDLVFKSNLTIPNPKIKIHTRIDDVINSIYLSEIVTNAMWPCHLTTAIPVICLILSCSSEVLNRLRTNLEVYLSPLGMNKLPFSEFIKMEGKLDVNAYSKS